MIQISPSLIEQYRLVSIGAFGLTGADLRTYITKRFEWHDAISRGAAWHEMIENGPENYAIFMDDHYEQKVIEYQVYEPNMNKIWHFSVAAVDRIFEFLDSMKGRSIVNEPWIDWTPEIQGEKIRVRMRADALIDNQIHEFKTSKYPGKYRKYLASMQWRCYLEALPDAAKVVYHCFQLPVKNNWCKYTTYEYGRNVYSRDELFDKISGLLHWLRANDDLLGYLYRKEDKNPLAGI